MATTSLGRTMDDLKAPAPTWAHEIQRHEQEKRRVVDEGFVNNRQVRVTGGQVKLQERSFDPLLQRFRDNGTELHQRTLEEKERVGHLNRAMDISILRTQPFDIVTHASKIEALAPGQDPMRQGHEKARNKEAGRPGGAMPTTTLDYNILSNIPQEHHHWAGPEARPHIAHKAPKDRVIPHFLVKDFNVVNNRYHDGHEERMARDKHLSILDAASKYQSKNRFDPLTQQFNDPRAEENSRTADHAREVEVSMRKENQIPPSTKGRESNHYDMVTLQIHDPEIIGMYDKHQAERKERYKNKYIVEHNLHKQDIKGDHINESRKLNRIAPERYQENGMRGFDLINGQRYGGLHHEKHLHEASTKNRLSAWDKFEQGHLSRPEVYPKDIFLSDGAYLENLDKCYFGDGRALVDRHERASASGAQSNSGRGSVMKPSASAPSVASGLMAPPAPGDIPEQSMAPARVAPSARSRGGEQSARSGKAGGAAHHRAGGGDGRPVPMPPGMTAPPSRNMPTYSESGSTLSQAGARAMSESGSAKHLRADLRSGPPSYAGSRPPSLRHSESAPDMTRGGHQVTFRGPTPAPAAMGGSAPRGYMAPPAPAMIPGSPGGGSQYSRRL